jgi:hypothetical protein
MIYVRKFEVVRRRRNGRLNFNQSGSLGVAFYWRKN